MGNRNGLSAAMAADAPLETLATGSKQSALPYRFDLIPPEALTVLARVLDYGANKYEAAGGRTVLGHENWRGIPVESHLNHVLAHINAYRGGDRAEDHLGHAQARLTFALCVALADGYDARQADERD